MNEGMSLDKLPELGVGLTYSSSIEPMITQFPDLIDILEIEPQTSWLEDRLGSGIYKISDPSLEHISELPFKKLVHSVGIPVGTSKSPDILQLELINKTIERLNAPWLSEHLSFNNGHDFFTGFFLPPRQTLAGIKTAIRNIQIIQEFTAVPVAIETGVNYFKTRSDELEDGKFIGKIVKESDCGILLDLHNLYTNHLNGRQSIYKFLDQVPLENVIEIHLAGGMELNGFWLDAHSGAIPKGLLDIACEIIPNLNNLKAIIFEIFPSFVPYTGFELIKEEIQKIRNLWTLRSKERRKILLQKSSKPIKVNSQNNAHKEDIESIEEWENAIGKLVTGQPLEKENKFINDFYDEPGIKLINSLIKEFRGSMIVAVLKLSSRFLMLALGPEIFRAYLEDFWSKNTPSPLASTEAAKFGAYMKDINLALPNFNELLEFELAVVATLLDDQTRVVTFKRNPLPLFRDLANKKLPTVDLEPGTFEIEITSEGPVQANGLSLAEIQEFFPSH